MWVQRQLLKMILRFWICLCVDIRDTDQEESRWCKPERGRNVEVICGYAECEAPARHKKGCMLGQLKYGSEVADM